MTKYVLLEPDGRTHHAEGHLPSVGEIQRLTETGRAERILGYVDSIDESKTPVVVKLTTTPPKPIGFKP